MYSFAGVIIGMVCEIASPLIKSGHGHPFFHLMTDYMFGSEFRP